MIVRATVLSKEFKFKKEIKTSRNSMTSKTSHFFILEDEIGKKGIGECSPIFGLSPEKEDNLESKINEVLYLLNHRHSPSDLELNGYPSLQFAIETAVLALNSEQEQILFPSDFTNGKKSIPINGLIWMGDIPTMKVELKTKIEQGFNCIKIKVGSNNLNDELELIRYIRREYNRDVVLRLDANGAFVPEEALPVLNKFAEFNIHSIEQPIQQGQWKEMAQLCQKSPIPIALDEELIGIESSDMIELLDFIQPQYLVLKPSLLGGLAACDKWISLAEERSANWWATSYLESNIGLNAISQWLASKERTTIYQGLGTGNIYSNNLESPLRIENEGLKYMTDIPWNLKEIFGDGK